MLYQLLGFSQEMSSVWLICRKLPSTRSPPPPAPPAGIAPSLVKNINQSEKYLPGPPPHDSSAMHRHALPLKLLRSWSRPCTWSQFTQKAREFDFANPMGEACAWPPGFRGSATAHEHVSSPHTPCDVVAQRCVFLTQSWCSWCSWFIGITLPLWLYELLNFTS